MDKIKNQALERLRELVNSSFKENGICIVICYNESSIKSYPKTEDNLFTLKKD